MQWLLWRHANKAANAQARSCTGVPVQCHARVMPCHEGYAVKEKCSRFSRARHGERHVAVRHAWEGRLGKECQNGKAGDVCRCPPGDSVQNACSAVLGKFAMHAYSRVG